MFVMSELQNQLKAKTIQSKIEGFSILTSTLPQRHPDLRY